MIATLVLRFVVTACREREAGVAYLRRHIPKLEVVWDTTGDAMDTFIAACDLIGDSDGVIRLEDDICLTKRFVSKVLVVADHRRDVIQFFSRSKADLTRGSRWNRVFSMNQCFYLPPMMSGQIARFFRSAAWKPNRGWCPTGYDILMTHLFDSQGRRHWISVPSLVEHANQPSMISARSRFRQSRTFTDPEMRGFPADYGVAFLEKNQ